MTTLELLQLLKPIFAEVEKSGGKLSLLEAVEVIDEFKKQNQDEAINRFIETYGFLYKAKLAQRAKAFATDRFENLKKTFLKCR